MKLSVFTVSTPDLTPEQLAREAKAAGLDGIEWRYKEVPEEAKGEAPSFWRNNLCSISPYASEEEQLEFKAAAERNGLVSLSVTPYLNDLDVAATERALRTAKLIGASFIRVGVAGYNRSETFGELFNKTRNYLREAAALCSEYGVKGLIEIHHNTIAPSPSAAYRLVEGHDPDTLGVLYDPGNMVHEGMENYRMGLELLGPYLAHVHVKNGAWKPGERQADGTVAWSCGWTPMREGIVNWKQVVADLKAVGYAGYLGIEDFSGQYDSRAMLHEFAAYMRELLG
ncbi:xylose isomerase [Gordoniibacillus kamchatkensis]|uniref:Xylose isomerase n=1 Tax=Gordoniibacillus kamchatkensis TaxID=1590651 RepID=A0ABR5AAZ6_9BACL|nr:sugar phosphate isomerase/epimerase [Paenibacillus sp. VKM B-2647]KIL38231.1 xylose isomerase [Paenibacillus sp. VKM B-2647]